MFFKSKHLFVLTIVLPGILIAGHAMAEEREEIVFWHYSGGTLGQQFKRVVDRFNEVQDRYRVTEMLIPWNSNQKLLTSLAAGIPPEVIMMDRPTAPDWIIRGALEDITEYVHQEGWTEKDFFTTPWMDSQYEDRFYMVPLYGDVRCLIYNRELFRQAGLDPDRPPQSWEELYEYAKQLTEWDESGRVRTLGFQGNTTIILLLGWQLGGDLADSSLTRITMATEPYIQGINYFKRLVDITGNDAFLRFLSSAGSELEAQDAFFNGRVGMKLVEGFYIVNQRRFAPHLDVQMAPFPMPNEEPPFSWLGGFALAMPRGCKNPDGAWAFIKYMSSLEAQTAIGTEMGMLPSLRAAAHQPEIYHDPNRGFLVDMLDLCKHYPKIPVVQEAYNELTRAVDIAIRESDTAENALRNAERNVQESLDRYAWQASLPLFPWNMVLLPLFVLAILAILVAVWAMVRYARQGPFSRNRMLAGYAFAAPWLFGFIVFMAGPIIISFIYSFCDYQVLTPARWAGIGNYQRMFTDDPLFWKSLWNTAYYTVFAVPLGLIASLSIAMLLNQPIKGMRIFRTIFYLPSLITGVAVAVMWMWILQPDSGIVNQAFRLFGFDGPLWLQSEYWSKPGLILMSFWGVGGSVIIFLAGLQGIPRQLYEAAEIDGAGAWGRFMHVTVPMLTPTIFFVLVVGIIGSFQIFTTAFVISGGTGAPLDSTLFYVLYLYRQGFENFYMGYASAMAWGLFAVVLVLTLLQFRMSQKWVHYG